MPVQLAENRVRPVPVQRVIASTPEWVHVLGSDLSRYLVPKVPPKAHLYQFAYRDAAFLRALEIPTMSGSFLSPAGDLAAAVGSDAAGGSGSAGKPLLGWRLPEERPGNRLLQVLPARWLPRITNRQQFMEVLVLDIWFSRVGQRKVIFRECGQAIEAIFLPSVSPTAAQMSTAQEAGYSQRAVYNGLSRADAEATVRARIGALSMPRLVQQFETLPEIGIGYEMLVSLWAETITNQVCFDQSVVDLMESFFGRAVCANEQRAFDLSADRLRSKCDPRAWHPLGRSGG